MFKKNGLTRGSYSTAVQSVANVSLNTFRRKMPGYRLKPRDIFISIACGLPALWKGTAIPMICWLNVSVTLRLREKMEFVFFRQRAKKENLCQTGSTWFTRALKLPTHRSAESHLCICLLMIIPSPPKFKECAVHPKTDEAGFVLYYTDQCPFTYYWVPRVEEAAKQNNIPLKTIHIQDKETAQSVPAPVSTYALFRDGKFVTHGIQSDKKFLKLAGVEWANRQNYAAHNSFSNGKIAAIASAFW